MRAALIAAALLIAALPVRADVAAGITAFNAQDFEGARAAFRAAGEAGDPAGWFYLGNLDYAGAGLDKPAPAAAANAWSKAAARGHAAAQLQLGQLYRRGEGVARDMGEATRWLYRAAENGEAEAAFYVAEIFLTGEGGAVVDVTHAAKMFRLAANQGFVPAQAKLGQLVFAGEGVPRDPVEGHMWLLLAAKTAPPELAGFIAEVIRDQEKALSSGERDRAARRADRWRPWAE